MPVPSSSLPSCPHCGRAIPAGAPLGACPHCLLAAGLASEPAAPADAPPPPAPAEIAAEFPQLEIVELLGRGGMGAVYKARQPALDRLVALKLLRPDLDADPSFAERFTREARTLAQLNHPGIVTLYEFGRTASGRFFILMEFVDGLNLRQLLAAGRLSPREALAIIPPLCDALQYAHDRGLVHRDIKPENILIDRLGRIKIADFGLAKLAGASAFPAPSASAAAPAAAFELTETGKVMGTPRYMAPEQRERPDAVDHRADIYALGVVLYQMLTGELPDAKQLQPPSRRVELDVRLDEIVLRALETDPSRRYQHASLFKTQVETVGADASAPQPAPGSPAASAAGSPVVFATLGLLVALYWGWVAYSGHNLPPHVASHFGFDGRPDASMPRRVYLLSIAAFPVALALFVQAMAWLTRHMPANLVNIPNRDFWLAPERRAETAAVMGRWLATLSCVIVVLFAQLHAAVVLANDRQPPRLPEGAFMGSMLALSLVLMLWVVGMLMRFAEPKAPAHTHRWRNRLLVGVSVCALALGTLPLAKAWRQRGPNLKEVPIATALLPATVTPAANSPAQLSPATNAPAQLTPAIPAPAAAGPDDTQRKISQLKLEQARRALQDAKTHHATGTLQTSELHAAEDRVTVLEAELTGDTAVLLKVQLVAAQRRLALIREQANAGMATRAAVDEAETEVAIIEAAATSQPNVANRVAQLKLEQARRDLKLIENRHAAGLAGPDELDSAKDRVALLEAELAGNRPAIAQIKLAAAQRLLQLVISRAQAGIATHAEVDAAGTAVAILQLEYDALAPTHGAPVPAGEMLSQPALTPQQPAAPVLAVVVHDNGVCVVDSVAVSLDQLNERFAAFAREAPQGIVRVQASEKTDPAHVIRVMSAARSNRLNRIRLATGSGMDLPSAQSSPTAP